jgi:hypothetical protein
MLSIKKQLEHFDDICLRELFGIIRVALYNVRFVPSWDKVFVSTFCDFYLIQLHHRLCFLYQTDLSLFLYFSQKVNHRTLKCKEKAIMISRSKLKLNNVIIIKTEVLFPQAMLFKPFDCIALEGCYIIALEGCYIIWVWNLSTLGAHNESYSRNVSCAMN